MMSGGVCECCGRPMPRQERGRPRKFCSKECRVLNESIVRLEKALGPVVDSLADDGQRGAYGLVELRYRMFTLLSDEVPRPRDSKGRFLKRRG